MYSATYGGLEFLAPRVKDVAPRATTASRPGVGPESKRCVYRKLKLGRSGGEVRREWRVI